MMSKRIFMVAAAAVALLGLEILRAQTPLPTTSAKTETAVAATVAPNSGTMATTLKVLREMKAVNEETLRKQQATLDALDELQKAAEQIKVFTKRG